MAWIDQSPELINSDICIRCGHCCKATLPVHQPFTVDDNHKRQKTEYIATVFADVDTIKVVDITNSKTGTTKVVVVKTCAKLDINKEGHKVCSTYENRPVVCKAFNCITTANHSQTTPQNWDVIKELIEEFPTDGFEIKHEA